MNVPLVDEFAVLAVECGFHLLNYKSNGWGMQTLVMCVCTSAMLTLKMGDVEDDVYKVMCRR